MSKGGRGRRRCWVQRDSRVAGTVPRRLSRHRHGAGFLFRHPARWCRRDDGQGGGSPRVAFIVIRCARRTDILSKPARPALAGVHASGAAVIDRTGVGVAVPDPGLIRPALVDGGHLRRNKAPSRHRDPTQWSDLAIARTAPVLMRLFSVITLVANDLQKQGRVRPTAIAQRRQVPIRATPPRRHHDGRVARGTRPPSIGASEKAPDPFLRPARHLSAGPVRQGRPRPRHGTRLIHPARPAAQTPTRLTHRRAMGRMNLCRCQFDPIGPFGRSGPCLFLDG